MNSTIADPQGIGTIEDDDRDGAFTCKATVLAIGDSTLIVANPPNDPCKDDSHSLLRARLASGSTVITADVGNAKTDQQPDDLVAFPPAIGDFAAAHTDLTNVVIKTGSNTITAMSASSDVKTECAAGFKPKLNPGSSVLKLTVNGKTIAVTNAKAQVPLGLATLKINHSVVTANETIQRALWIDFALSPDIIVGEARSGYRGNPCTE